MPFEKGHKKVGGRKAGVENRLTKEMRSILKDLIYEELDNLPELMESMSPVERVNLLMKLIPYALPKIQSVHMEEGEPLDWSI